MCDGDALMGDTLWGSAVPRSSDLIKGKFLITGLSTLEDDTKSRCRNVGHESTCDVVISRLSSGRGRSFVWWSANLLGNCNSLQNSI